MNAITLQEALTALLGNGSMGVAVFYVWLKIEAMWPILIALDIELKRVLLAIVSFVLVQFVYLAAVLATAVPAPISFLAWFSTSFVYASIAFSAATLTHGAQKARGKI